MNRDEALALIGLMWAGSPATGAALAAFRAGDFNRVAAIAHAQIARQKA